MKQKRVVILMLTMAIIVMMTIPTLAGYFIGESIELKDKKDILLVSNVVTIELEKQKVTNEFLLQNVGKQEKEYTFSIPLEDTIAGNKVEKVVVKINGTEVMVKQEKKDQKTCWNFTTKMKIGEYKKVVIQYTAKELKNASILKYRLENFGIETKCQKLQVKFVFPEIDIPLVTKIEPANFKFTDNIVSFTYYNTPISELNREFIIEKTVYGEEISQREIIERKEAEEQIEEAIDYEKKRVFGLSKAEFLEKVGELIRQNFKDWTKNGISLNTQNAKGSSDVIKNLLREHKINPTFTYLDENGKEQAADYYLNNTYGTILEYVILKQLYQDHKQDLISTYYQGEEMVRYFNNNPLILEMIRQKDTSNKLPLKDNLIVVDIPNIGQEIYSEVTIATGQIEKKEIRGLTLTNLYEAKKPEHRIEKIVYIPGNSNLTEEQRAEFANHIGADIYIRLQVKELEEQRNNALREKLKIPFLPINQWNANFESGKTIVSDNEENDYRSNTETIKKVILENQNEIQKNKQERQQEESKIEENLTKIEKSLGVEEVIEKETNTIVEETKPEKVSKDTLFIVLVSLLGVGISICIIFLLFEIRKKKMQ